MKDLFTHIYSLVSQEKERQDQTVKRKENTESLLQQTPFVVGAALLGLGLGSLLQQTLVPGVQELFDQSSPPKTYLKDFSNCGELGEVFDSTFVKNDYDRTCLWDCDW